MKNEAYSERTTRRTRSTRMLHPKVILSCLLMMPALAPPASGLTVSLSAIDTGFVTPMGGSAKGDGTVSGATYNYSAGRELHYLDGTLFSPIGYMDRKNYFVFDLSSVTGPITSATLKVYMGPDTAPAFPGGTHGYESLDPTETFELFETTDPGMALGLIGDLLTLNSTVGAPAFDETSDPGVLIAGALHPLLGDGPLLLGGYTASPADDGTIIEIPITAGGLGYLSAFAGGTLVLAGTVPTSGGPPDPDSQLLFGFTGPDIPGGDVLTPVLEVTYVPEPGCPMLVCAAVCLLARRRLRK